MKTTKTLIIAFMVAIIISGCGKNSNTTDNINTDASNNINSSHSDKFVPLYKEPEVEETQEAEAVDNEVKEKFEEYGDMSWYEAGEDYDDEPDEEDQYIENQNDAYKDAYTSNIDMSEDIDRDLSEYDWYNIQDDTDMYYNTHQYIAYGISKYYNDDVPYTFWCKLPDDIISQETNMIFTVQAHSDSVTLELLLDMYNEKIIVNENQ